MFYRRRATTSAANPATSRSSCATWGGAYDYMIVLDADSIMSGEALVTLARLMDAHPEVGIIQTLPLPAGRETLFARLIQFAARLNGRCSPAAWPSGSWGRATTGATTRSCGCGRSRALRAAAAAGPPPFGGEILSHDFVEAAFMRRAGYKVLAGARRSAAAGKRYRPTSSTMRRAIAAGRRAICSTWACMPMRGLHWLSRLHLLTGILSYVSSPMWLLVLIISSIVTCIEAVSGHHYFQPGAFSLFPTWPQYRDSEIAALLTMTVIVLLLPKMLGAVLVLKDRSLRAAFGGAPGSWAAFCSSSC